MLARLFESALRRHRSRHSELAPLVEKVIALAKSNYEIQYTPEYELSERVIFPFSPSETNGIEDARFVHFHDDDGSSRYYATYSAYNGQMVLPQLHGLEGADNAVGDLAADLQGGGRGGTGSIAYVDHASLADPQEVIDHRAVRG